MSQPILICFSDGLNTALPVTAGGLFTKLLSSPKALKLAFVREAEREFPGVRVRGDAGEFAQGFVDMFGADLEALFLVALERARSDGDAELPLGSMAARTMLAPTPEYTGRVPKSLRFHGAVETNSM